jgi:hypothetical protein
MKHVLAICCFLVSEMTLMSMLLVAGYWALAHATRQNGGYFTGIYSRLTPNDGPPSQAIGPCGPATSFLLSFKRQHTSSSLFLRRPIGTFIS